MNMANIKTFPAVRNLIFLLALLGLATGLSGCGINNIPTYEENAKAKWSQVFKPVSAPYGSHPQPRQDRQRLCCPRKRRTDLRCQCASQGDFAQSACWQGANS